MTTAAEIYKADDGTGSAGWTPSLLVVVLHVGSDAIIRTNGVNLTEDATVGPTAMQEMKSSHMVSIMVILQLPIRKLLLLRVVQVSH